MRPNRVTLNIDGELQVIRPRTVFRGIVPENGAQFMLVVQAAEPGDVVMVKGSNGSKAGAVAQALASLDSVGERG